MKTIEQKTILLAEKAGWEIEKDLTGVKPPGCDAFTYRGYSSIWTLVPNYFHSLDAVAELEKLIIGDLEKLYTNAETYAEWRLYRSILNHNVCATAAQRADALGVTWGLWTLEECEK